jgi:hypothetical protein
MCRVSARRLSIYNFAWGLLKATKKVYLIPQKWKNNKDTYGFYPTKFASSTQKYKKVIETPNQPIEIKKSQIKVCLVLQEFAGSTQNPKKNHRNTKSTNQNENFPKKTVYRTLKV